jgi:hypothetical protein
MSQVVKMITELEGSSFYGDVTLKFENGEIVLILKTEKIKPNHENKIR